MTAKNEKKKNMIYFAFLGLFGGLINVVVSAMSFSDLFTFASLRNLVLAFLIGIFYWFLHTEKKWPDSVMAIVSGYAGVTFIESILTRL